MSFFMRFFCATSLFTFQDSVWIVKLPWCVCCCSTLRIYWFCVRCRSKGALWCIFARKSCCHNTGCFLIFLVLITKYFLFYIKNSGKFLELVMNCLLVNGSWECLIVEFRFFSGNVSFYVFIIDAVFLVTIFFYFWGQCLANEVNLICSFLFISTILLGLQS